MPSDARYTREQDLTNAQREEIEDALAADHPCDDRSCGIAVAHSAGFLLAASRLLLGATEAYELSDVLERHAISIDPASWDTDGWADYHAQHGVKCLECGCFTYGDEGWTPDTCGDCRAILQSA
ncbi:hypothetical protein [Crossiella sp. CA198]|uniref:hypothetical protein n=1 Tax=Crossiella sp. CA198 TaxID=3455607 RepID=UPI003F8D8E2E